MHPMLFPTAIYLVCILSVLFQLACIYMYSYSVIVNNILMLHLHVHVRTVQCMISFRNCSTGSLASLLGD